MESSATGRLGTSLPSELRKLVYGRQTIADRRESLELFALLDECQTLLLVDCSLLSADDAREVLRFIAKERHDRFRGSLAQPAPRGAYLAWETYASTNLPSRLNGVLQLGRSRNDMTATIQRMGARAIVERVTHEALQLMSTLIKAAHRDRETIIPAFTHMRPAVPIRASQLWLAWCASIAGSLSQFEAVATEADCLPLGAAAIGGSRVPLNRELGARPLGFSRVALNPIHAIASKDYHLNLVSGLVTLCTSIGRFTNDLATYTAGPNPLLDWPDELLGSSSNMPQKANPFLLELLQGRSVTPSGQFVSSAMKLHGTPFTNSFVLSTELEKGLQECVSSTLDCIRVLRQIVRSVRFSQERSIDLCLSGVTYATSVAEQIAMNTDIPYRQAHHEIGALTIEQDPHRLIESYLRERLPQPGLAIALQEIADANENAGGEGNAGFNQQLRELDAAMLRARVAKKQRMRARTDAIHLRTKLSATITGGN